MIKDWDDAYSNSDHIENSASYPAKWATAAANFRNNMPPNSTAILDVSYGYKDREKYDVFKPKGTAKGLVIFVHGGYWKAFDKSYWSHLANGPLKHDWAVFMPNYTLAPDARLAQITGQMGPAIDRMASKMPGYPLHLVGHSAGGHLVSRMVCDDSPLSPPALASIRHVMSVSGLHDLRALRNTTMNNTLNIDADEAISESPALRDPAMPDGKAASVTCWVGAKERPEFIRQNDLLANIWTGLGAATQSIHAPEKHHFNVIDDLCNPESDMTRCLLSGITEDGD